MTGFGKKEYVYCSLASSVLLFFGQFYFLQSKSLDGLFFVSALLCLNYTWAFHYELLNSLKNHVKWWNVLVLVQSLLFVCVSFEQENALYLLWPLFPVLVSLGSDFFQSKELKAAMPMPVAMLAYFSASLFFHRNFLESSDTIFMLATGCLAIGTCGFALGDNKKAKRDNELSFTLSNTSEHLELIIKRLNKKVALEESLDPSEAKTMVSDLKYTLAGIGEHLTEKPLFLSDYKSVDYSFVTQNIERVIRDVVTEPRVVLKFNHGSEENCQLGISGPVVMSLFRELGREINENIRGPLDVGISLKGDQLYIRFDNSLNEERDSRNINNYLQAKILNGEQIDLGGGPQSFKERFDRVDEVIQRLKGNVQFSMENEGLFCCEITIPLQTGFEENVA